MRRNQPDPQRRIKRREPAATEKSWERQEKRMAKAIPQGKRTPGSGNGWAPSKKGDVVGKLFRGEGKTRAKAGAKSITIKRADLDKIDHEALRMRQVSVFVFGFEDGYDRISFRYDVGKALMHIAELVRAGRHDEAQAIAEALV